MMLAGLTGGIACGKSFVAQIFASLGARIIEADDLGREVLLPGNEAFGPVLEAFGRQLLTAEGLIDRAALARQVFNDPRALAQLNALVHPAVRARAMCQAEHWFTEDPHAVVVYVAAILIESGAYRECNKLIVVSCTPEQQLERAIARAGNTAKEEEIRARIARQIPLEAKRKYADYLIETSGTKEETARQTKLVYEELLRNS